jgi:hypothetical protein
MTYYVNDWAARDGFIPPYMMVMSLVCGIPTIGLVAFMVWGKSFRRRSKDSSVHHLE